MLEPRFYHACADGHQMPVYEWLPSGEQRSAILIVHGMAEHAARYHRFASFLNGHGHAVYAIDLRAHGKAVSNSGALGVVAKDWVTKQIADIHSLISWLKNAQPERPVILFGHSMGSFIAQRFAQMHSALIDGLVLSGTNGAKDPLLPVGIFLSRQLAKWKGSAYKSDLLFKLTFGKFNLPFRPNRTDFDWLSRDAAEVDKYIADPHCGFVCSVQLLHDLFVMLQTTFSFNSIAAIRTDLPVYAFAGDKDPVGMQGKGFMKLVSNWRMAGIKNLQHKLYKDGRHEMLNETNRDEVMWDVLHWMHTQHW